MMCTDSGLVAQIEQTKAELAVATGVDRVDLAAKLERLQAKVRAHLPMYRSVRGNLH